MNAIFKQKYSVELFIALKMAYSCCFGIRRNLDFPDFLQKKFYNINYRTRTRTQVITKSFGHWPQSKRGVGSWPTTYKIQSLLIGLNSLPQVFISQQIAK